MMMLFVHKRPNNLGEIVYDDAFNGTYSLQNVEE